MKVIVLNSTNPYYNLAVEEYLFLHSEERVFMLWQNDKTVVIGKNQNAYTEVDKKIADSYGVKISRRITGGGAVYHDLGNVNYSYIDPNSTCSDIDFKTYTAPIIKALKSMGVTAKLSGRNDLETLDGFKISGSAQHRVGNRVLHHGTLLFSSDLDFMSKVLTPSVEKLNSKAVKSVKKRVLNVSKLSSVKSVSEFISTLKDFILKEFNGDETPLPNSEEIDALFARNSSYEWIFGEKSMVVDYQKIIAKRFDFGTLEVKVNLSGDVIKSIKITGDFFGKEDISLLEKKLENTLLSTIDKTLDKLDLSAFILGITNKEFIQLLND